MGDREKGGKRNTNKGEKERGEREGQDGKGDWPPHVDF